MSTTINDTTTSHTSLQKTTLPPITRKKGVGFELPSVDPDSTEQDTAKSWASTFTSLCSGIFQSVNDTYTSFSRPDKTELETQRSQRRTAKPKKTALRSPSTNFTIYSRVISSEARKASAQDEYYNTNFSGKPTTKQSSQATKSALSRARSNSKSAKRSDWFSRETKTLLTIAAIGLTFVMLDNELDPYGRSGVDNLSSACGNAASLAWSAASFVGSCGWSLASEAGSMAGSAISGWMSKDTAAESSIGPDLELGLGSAITAGISLSGASISGCG